MRSQIAPLAVAVVLLVAGLGISGEQRTGSAPSESEEDRLRQDMRRWNLDRLITGSPPLESYTDAELAAYAELLARGHANRLKKEYQLTPEQEKIVGKRLEELKKEYRSYWKKNQPELGKLNGQIKQMSRNRSDPAIAERVKDLIRRRSRLISGQPLNPSVVNATIEELLPEEQIAATEERRESGAAARLAQLRLITGSRPAGSRPAATRPAPIVQLRSRAASPFSSWRAYVNLFIDAYDLSDEQQARAESILEELEDRRDDYQESHEKEFVALRNTMGLEARFRKGEALRAPIARMYEELLRRLEQIPTAAQRRAADEDAKAATTQPSLSRSIPALRLRPLESRPSAGRPDGPASP